MMTGKEVFEFPTNQKAIEFNKIDGLAENILVEGNKVTLKQKASAYDEEISKVTQLAQEMGAKKIARSMIETEEEQNYTIFSDNGKIKKIFTIYEEAIKEAERLNASYVEDNNGEVIWGKLKSAKRVQTMLSDKIRKLADKLDSRPPGWMREELRPQFKEYFWKVFQEKFQDITDDFISDLKNKKLYDDSEFVAIEGYINSNVYGDIIEGMYNSSKI